MDGSGGIALNGTEVAVITAMLSVLAGTIAALWFAYSQAMTKRIDSQAKRIDALMQILFSAIALVVRIFERADGRIITAQDQAELDSLRQELRSMGPSKEASS